MSFIARWFKREKPRVGLRPHRDVELLLPFGAAYDRVLEAIELALGAYISVDDRQTGFVEAAFGTVNNERVRCSLERLAEQRTGVRIEAFFPAGLAIPERSAAVDALADMLGRDSLA
jgi:hypothetical protein